MSAIPDDLVRYRKEGGPDFASTEGDPGYFQLWPADETEKWNQEYQVPEYAPGFTGFGSDGGGEMLAFDSEGRVYMIPFVGMCIEDARLIGGSWSDIASRISHE